MKTGCKEEPRMNDKNMAIVGGELVELVDIDGVKYVEQGSDFVPYVQKRVEVEAQGRKVEFAEGGRYENYFGVCEVLRIGQDGRMDVRYVSAMRSEVSVGSKYVYGLKAQAEAVAAEARRKEQELVRSGVAVIGKMDVPLVEWIANRGCIRAQMRPDMQERFEDVYEDLTGAKADPDYVLYGDSYFEGAYGLCVEFPQPPAGVEVALPDGIKLHSSGGTLRIWNNAYVKGMLKAGLKLGRNQGWGARQAA
jgi:hypothetical protein